MQDCLCLKRGKSINFVPCLSIFVFFGAVELASRLHFKVRFRVQNFATFIGSHVFDISDTAREEKLSSNHGTFGPNMALLA